VTRLTLTIDGLAAWREDATRKINQAFAHHSSVDGHRTHAHARKREIANSVMNGGAAPDAFAEEAKLRSISVDALAKMIISKPAPIDAFELERQRRLIAIEQATTKDELDRIVLSGVSS